MPRYRLFETDGTDAGEAQYAQLIRVGDEIHVHGHRTVKVLEP